MIIQELISEHAGYNTYNLYDNSRIFIFEPFVMSLNKKGTYNLDSTF